MLPEYVENDSQEGQRNSRVTSKRLLSIRDGLY